ncbi:hypothetical protein DIPPA_07900 [Diplonema papillatum]|nr:hypothetical protein DIPPA_07900 [Diplonema papillatum]
MHSSQMQVAAFAVALPMPGSTHSHVQSSFEFVAVFGSLHFCPTEVHVPFEQWSHCTTHSSSTHSAAFIKAVPLDGGGQKHSQLFSVVLSGSLQICPRTSHVPLFSKHSSIAQAATAATAVPVVGGKHSHR